MVVINVDTTKDSADELEDIVQMLKKAIAKKRGTTNSNYNNFSDYNKPNETSFTNIFAEETSNDSETNSESPGGVFGMFDNNFESEEKKETNISKDQSTEEILKIIDEEDEDATIEVDEDDDDVSIEIVEY